MLRSIGTIQPSPQMILFGMRLKNLDPQLIKLLRFLKNHPIHQSNLSKIQPRQRPKDPGVSKPHWRSHIVFTHKQPYQNLTDQIQMYHSIHPPLAILSQFSISKDSLIHSSGGIKQEHPITNVIKMIDIIPSSEFLEPVKILNFLSYHNT